ncbi:MAG: TRAP transporter small permease [Rhizobacter sp.]|nr:TRAP transporter small permease [Rhizobacter sp.]
MSTSVSVDAPPSAPGWVTGVLGVWYWIERLLAIVTFGAIGVLMMYDVISREIIGPVLTKLGMDPSAVVLVGSQKLGVYFLIAGAFTGLSLATATGAQLVPKVGFGWAPKSWNAGMNRLGDFITTAFLAIVTYYAVVFVQSSASIGLMTTSGVEMKVWVLQTAIPIGFASAAARYLVYGLWPATRPVPPEFQE